MWWVAKYGAHNWCSDGNCGIICAVIRGESFPVAPACDVGFHLFRCVAPPGAVTPFSVTDATLSLDT